MYEGLTRWTKAKTARCSSYDTAGRNNDRWCIEPGETRVLADIAGPGRITHIWMTQPNHYRECLGRAHHGYKHLVYRVLTVFNDVAVIYPVRSAF